MEFTFNNSWRTALRIARNARNAASRTTSAWPWLTSKPNLLSRNLRSPSGEPSFEELPIRGAWPVARHRSTNWDEVSILQKSILMEGRKSNQAINQSIIQSLIALLGCNLLLLRYCRKSSTALDWICKGRANKRSTFCSLSIIWFCLPFWGGGLLEVVGCSVVVSLC